MKIFLIALILSVSLEGPAIYDFKVPGLDGSPIDFSAYKGKKNYDRKHGFKMW